jgi:hypothetical protein
MAVSRNLKSQLQADNKRVFLNLDEFGTLERIRYWSNGREQRPIELNIPVCIETDGDSTKTWNKQQSYQTTDHEMVLMQKSVVLYALLEDFGEAPARKRYMQVGQIVYQISMVSVQGGMLVITLRNLEE